MYGGARPIAVEPPSLGWSPEALMSWTFGASPALSRKLDPRPRGALPPNIFLRCWGSQIQRFLLVLTRPPGANSLYGVHPACDTSVAPLSLTQPQQRWEEETKERLVLALSTQQCCWGAVPPRCNAAARQHPPQAHGESRHLPQPPRLGGGAGPLPSEIRSPHGGRYLSPLRCSS